MPKREVYKRVRDGLVFADVGKVHLELLDKMVAEDHSDKTKFLRWMIEEEWARRGHPRLVSVIGEEVAGADQVPIYQGGKHGHPK